MVYDTPLRLDVAAHSFTLMEKEIAANSQVLDIGCATARLAEHLTQNKGCTCYGVEMDPESCAIARDRLTGLFEGSILDPELFAKLPADNNVIICSDVLEHLPRPDRLLEGLREKLRPEGIVLVALPNIAHYSIRIRLALGRFDYTDEGILDRTHLRFYTLRTARSLFESCGIEILSESPTSSALPMSVLRLWPTALSTRFVFKLRYR